MSPQARETKNKQMWWHQATNVLHKGNYKQNKTTAYWMRGYMCKWFIWSGVNVQNMQRIHITQHQKNKQPD